MTNRSAYLYILPFGVIFAVFGLYPILYSAVLSFQDYQLGIPATWSGFDNYARALRDSSFWLSLKNVVLLMGVVLPCQLVFGFFIATIMHAKLGRRTGVLAGIYYLPVVANLVVVTLLFQALFQQHGLVNYFIGGLGLGPLSWLTSPTWAPITTMILIFWKGVGWYIVFLLAGLRNIDPTYYEAAKLDGANSFQQAIHISVPQLRPIITFLLVLGIISGWQIFTEPALLFGGNSGTGRGGPANSVLTPAIYIYQQGFTTLDFGYASALSMILALITIVASGIALRIGRRES